MRDVIKGSSLWKAALPATRLISSAVVLGCLFIHTAAHAIPIGDFNWNEYSSVDCDFFGHCGAFFSVDNVSTEDYSLGALGDTFFDTSVGLQTDGGALSLLLGDIAPGASSQSSEDLFNTTIASAVLTLTFGLPPLPGSVQLLDELGNVVTALTGPGSLVIDYLAPVEPVAVAEPSTLLLLVGGILALAHARWASSKSRGTVRRRDRGLAA